MTKRSFWMTALPLIIICQSVGVLGSLVTIDQIPTWYAALEKPSFNPPNWIFGPVWTFLYGCMGIAGAYLWKTTSRKRSMLLQLFGIQLFLNAVWSPIFFGAQAIAFAAVIIVLLDICVIALIATSWSTERRAAYLLLPYLAWILFATALNIALPLLN